MRLKTTLALACGGLALSGAGLTPLALAQTQVGAASPRTAQTPTALPASLDRGTLINWLRTNTDLDPAAVISVSPANIIGLLAINREEPATRRLYRVQIRSEVISAQTIREGGNNSWAADVMVDCDTRKGKVNRILDFPMRNLRGTAREAGGSAEFVAPPPGTHLYTVVAAVCDGTFQRPLGVTSPRVASVQPAPPPQPQSPSRLPPASSGQAPVRSPAAQVQAAASPPAPAKLSPPLRTLSPAPVAAAAVQPQPQPRPPAPQPAPPAVTRPQAPPPQAPPAQPRSGRGSAAVVQVAAVSSEAAARDAGRLVQSAFPDRTQDLQLLTPAISAGGRTVFRVMFKGFPTTGDAKGFCYVMRSAGRDCLVRDGDGPSARMISLQ